MRRTLFATAGGASAAALSALCCLGTPAILAFLGAIGAGFLVNDLVLLPLLAVSLLVSLWGLEKGRAMHRNPGPLRLGTGGALLLAAGIFLGSWAVIVGATLLIAATVWNAVAFSRCEPADGPPPTPPGEDGSEPEISR